MFERFTERARQAVVLAQDEARLFGHGHIGTEHLLLGVLREEEGVAAEVLAALGVTLADVRAAVEETVGRGEGTPTGQMPFTPRGKQALELSLREALRLDHNWIGTEHILLALTRMPESAGGRILARAGVDEETARTAVLERVGRGGKVRRRVVRTPVAAKWDYDVADVEDAAAIDEALLQPRGDGGWELATVVPLERGFRLVFKRRNLG